MIDKWRSFSKSIQQIVNNLILHFRMFKTKYLKINFWNMILFIGTP